MTGEVFGFSPNWYEGQQNKGLAFYVSPGKIGTTLIPGQVITVLPNATTNISMDSNGNFYLYFGAGFYSIATIMSGAVLTSTPNTLPVSSLGILSIQDQRPVAFSF